MSLTMIVTNAGRAALVNAANTGTAPVTIVSCGISGSVVAPDATATNLPGEVKRILTLSGDVVADDTIHLVVRDAGTDVFTLRSFALYLGDGTLFAIYGQAAVILEKSAQSIMLLAIDVKFADVAANSLTFGDSNFLNPPATTEQIGVVELATSHETFLGTDTQRAVTPKATIDAVNTWNNARFGPGNSAIWHPGNDGAGSGLDADLLDGQQGSFYSDIPGRLGFVPANRAGDTFTGNVGAPVFAVGSNAFYSFNGGNPAITFDSNDYQFYNRATNTYNFVIGGVVQAAIDSAGNVNTAVGLRAGGNVVWHAGNDGAGSGADADLLDGQQGSYYGDIPARLGFTPVNRAGDVIYGRMMLSGNVTGNSDIGNAASNLGEIEVRGNGAGAAMMTFHRPGSHAVYFGIANDNTLRLGGWSLGNVAHLIWHSGNDGSGSGMDADLLDGQHGGYYGDIPARLGFTPANKAGDTFTGPIRRDGAFYLDFSVSNPIVNFDANDYLLYDRAGNSINFVIGGTVQAAIEAGGYINAATGLRAAGNMVWHVGNDGSGSGMDADLLDGQHGGYYGDIPARLGFTPANKAGDTFTGAIRRDGAFYLDFTGPNPLINFDALDYQYYDRAGNNLITVIGGAVQASVDSGGYVNAAVGLRAAGNVAWHAGNDGSGSGMDADLLDGQHGSYYGDIPARLGFNPANRAGDTFTGPVYLTFAGNPKLSINSIGAVVAELAAQSDGNVVFYRNGGGGSVPIWNVGTDQQFNFAVPAFRAGSRLWDAGNDGSGSGLDADLLDGYHASAFDRVVAENLAANGGYIVYASGRKEAWGFIVVGQDSYGSWPVPAGAGFTSWVHPTFSYTGKAGTGNTGDNTMISSVTTAAIGVYNAEDTNVTVYIRVIGV